MTKEQVEERIYSVNLYHYFDDSHDFNESLKNLTISYSKKDTERLFEFLHKLLVEMCFSDNEFKQNYSLKTDGEGHYYMVYDYSKYFDKEYGDEEE